MVSTTYPRSLGIYSGNIPTGDFAGYCPSSLVTNSLMDFFSFSSYEAFP